jgi:hypothetical protein
MFFPTSMIYIMVPFRTFSFLDFLADLLQKSISVASNVFACCVFSVHVSAPYSKILWTKAWYIIPSPSHSSLFHCPNNIY